MTDKKFQFWSNCLVWANIMPIFVGLAAAFFPNSFVFDLHNEGTRQVFFEGQALPPNVLALKNWLFGIIGGSIVGFHLLMIFIIKNAFAKKEKWAYQALWAGLLSWFVIDSSITTYYQAYHNLYLINFVALALIVVPLITVRKCF